jgi:hypothetical protein
VNSKWCGEDKQPSGEGEKTNWKENETPKAGERRDESVTKTKFLGSRKGEK